MKTIRIGHTCMHRLRPGVMAAFTAVLWLTTVSAAWTQCGPVISTFPYTEGFESTAAWTSGGTGNDWAWGTPAHPLINSAGGGSKCWCVGNLNGTFYNYGEQSWLMSPCFDFSSLTYPWISFKIFWESERTYDGMQMQYSLNGGTTWTQLGNYSDPVNCLNQNWYNITNVNYLNLASGTRHAWSGRVGGTSGSCQGGSGSGGWVTAMHCMSALAGQPNVRFRFIFGAGSQCNSYDGIAIDDILIQNAAPNNANFSSVCAGGNTVNFTNLSALCPTGYAWNFGDPGSGASNTSTAVNPSHTFSAPGTYTVTLTASGPCNAPGTTTQTITVLGVSITPNNPSCNGSTNGTATANVTGSAGPFTYSWMPGGQTTQTATGLGAGTYTVTVSGAGFCSASSTVTLTNPTTLNAAITGITNANCSGSNNGSLTVSPSGGSPGYTYSWAPSGGNSVTASGLAPGIYTVTVTDSHGCTKTATGTVTAPSALNATISAQTNPPCFGNTNGSATVSATGGTPGYTYAWMPSGGNGTTANNLSAQTYTVTVTDNHGCTSSTTATITQPSQVTATITAQSNVSCYGQNNGSATVTAGGGTPGYTYSWLPSGITTPAASGLGPGNYIVVVTDAHNCFRTATVTITQPPALTASITSTTNVACYGGSTGSATVSAAGGTGGYTYSWLPYGGYNNSASGLAAGTYTVTVTDGSGCTKTATANITQPPQLTAAFTSVTQPTCGNNNGSGTVTATGGAGGYTYTWLPSGGNGNSASGLGNGTYTVTVTDANGCTATATTTLFTPNAITLSITGHTDINCYGGSNGTITTGTSGGGGGNMYTWLPSGGSGANANNLTAGTYTVILTDINNCSASATITLTEPPALTAAITNNIPISCFGNMNGSLTVTAAGGSGGYTYAWTPSGGTSPTASSLGQGSYTVTVTDNHGCTSSTTAAITQPAQLTASFSNVTQPTCGNTNGSATIFASGGNGGYSYAWLPSGGNSATASNLGNGSYTVTVTDANGCTVTADTALFTPNALSIAITSHTDISCFGGNNGAITTSSNGGGGGNIYAWLPAGGSGANANNLTAGSYTVTVTDVNNCSASASITLTAPPALTANITNNSPVSCFGGTDGSLTVTAAGGSGGYTYAWSPSGGTNAIAGNLAQGNYTVTVTDANNCTASTNATIAQPILLTLTVSGLSDITCNGQQNGAAVLNGNGGTGTLFYNWSPSGSGSSASNLAAGNYTVTVSDQNGCTASVNFSISEPPALIAGLTLSDDSICSGDPVTLTANAGGGTGAFSYTWDGNPGSTIYNVNPATTTTYTLVVTDQNGCSQSQTATVYAGAMPVASFTTGPVCLGTATAFTNTSSVAGAGSIIAQSWDFGDGTPADLSVNPAHNYGAAGTYPVTLSVITEFGCSNSTQQQVTVYPMPVVNFSADLLSGCAPLCVNLTDMTNTGGNPITSWNWLVNGQSVSGSPSPSYCFTNAGNYDVELQVVTAGNCSATLSMPQYIQVFPNPVAAFYTDQVVVPFSTPQITVTDASADAVSWLYDFGDGTTNNQPNELHTYADTGTYCILLQVTSAHGCTDEVQHCIQVIPEVHIFIPNSFTPNGDGHNDVFIIRGDGLREATLTIFDRWGEEMLHQENGEPFTTGWDGKYRGERAPMGMYVYKVFVLDNQGDVHEFMGHINLLR